MGVCCNKKNTKPLDMDFIWESLPIRRMSLVEYKKRIFIISSMNLNDINSFEKIFMRDLLLHGNDESQNAIRDLFINFAQEKGIPLVIFTLLFLCRNDESIDKSYIVCELDKLLDLKLVEKDEKGFYMSRDNYTKVVGIYIDLISRFGVQYVKKIKNIIIADNAEECYGKNVQERWMSTRLNGDSDGEKVYLSNLSKNEWNVLNDDCGIRKRLEVLFNEMKGKEDGSIGGHSDHNIELIKKEEAEEAKVQEVVNQNDISAPGMKSEEWEDSTHPDMAKFYNVL
jgi:hypothetical protein